MSNPAEPLTNDPIALQAMLAAERAENERLRQIIKELQRHMSCSSTRESQFQRSIASISNRPLTARLTAFCNLQDTPAGNGSSIRRKAERPGANR